MRARREVVSAVAKRYQSAERSAKGRILDELCISDATIDAIAEFLTPRWQGRGVAADAILSIGRNCFCEAARQGGPGRRSTCHAQATKTAL